MLRRLLAVLAALSLVPLVAATLQEVATAAPAPEKVEKPAYRTTIRQTKHGIPHITGKTFGDLGYGSAGPDEALLEGPLGEVPFTPAEIALQLVRTITLHGPV